MEVHKHLGGGLSEVLYKDALQIEFDSKDIFFQREQLFEVFYKGIKLPHYYFADFIVFGSIILEIKSVSQLTDAHIAQTINYMKLSGCRVALLVNFNKQSLEYKRLVL